MFRLRKFAVALLSRRAARRDRTMLPRWESVLAWISSSRARLARSAPPAWRTPWPDRRGGEEDDMAWVVYRESEATVAISGEAIDHGADFCCRDRFMEGVEFPKASYERIVGEGG